MKFHRAEEIFLVIGVAILVLSMVITGYQGFAKQMGPPSGMETLDPEKVDEHELFSEPGVYEVGENKYQVVMTLQVFQYISRNIEISVGSVVEIILSS